MAGVAKLHLEWLAFASLLLSRFLAHWTLTCVDLVSQTQLSMQSREAVVVGLLPYTNEAYYQNIINAKGEPPKSQRAPCSIFTGGLERSAVDLEFVHSVVDILHRSPGEPKLLVQATPGTKLQEVRGLIKDYCKECKQSDEGWKDLSSRLVTYPYFDDKLELIEYFWENGHLLVAVTGGAIKPHTRTIDHTHAEIPTLDLTPPGAEWQGRVPMALNKALLVGHVLNTADRGTFTETGVTLLSEPAQIAALRVHILELQKAERLFFDSTSYYPFSVYLQELIPNLLKNIQTARKEAQISMNITSLDDEARTRHDNEVSKKLDDYHHI